MSKKTAREETITVLAADLATKIEAEQKTIGYNYGELLTTHKTKSAMIRFLSADGFQRGQIAKFMGIKYQFVRNVLVTPIKKQA